MVSNTRAIAAVVVTAVTTVAIQTCLEMRRLNRLKPSIEQMVEESIKTEFSPIFDAGWNAALNNFSVVSKRYHEYIQAN